MARVTVEDCVDKVPNRFDLVMLSAHRARELSSGGPTTIDRDNDKNPVVALREIGDGALAPEALYESAVESQQQHIEVDEPEEDDMALLMSRGHEAARQPAADELDEEKLLRALLAEQGR